MEKDEILKLYRNLRKDEGIENIVSHGRKIGLRISYVTCIILVCISVFLGDGSTFRAISSLIFLMLSTEFFYKYKFFKNKFYIFGSVTFLLVSIIYFIDYFAVSIN